MGASTPPASDCDRTVFFIFCLFLGEVEGKNIEKKKESERKKEKKKNTTDSKKLTKDDANPGGNGRPRVRGVDGFGDLPLQQQRSKLRGDGNRRRWSFFSVVASFPTATALALAKQQHLPPALGVGPSHDHDRVFPVGLEHDDGGPRRRRWSLFLAALFARCCCCCRV